MIVTLSGKFYYYNYYNLFLEKKFAVLCGHVKKKALIGSALRIDASQSDVGVIAVSNAVDVSAYHLTFLCQRVEQLLQPFQTYK